MLRLYTFADKRPDFIALQADTVNRYLKDHHELVVFNNAIDSKDRFQEIERTCRALGLRTIHVSKNRSGSHIGGERVFSIFGRYRNPNLACAYPINWAWKRMIDENSQNAFVLIDSDMFFCRPISLLERTAGKQAGVIMQYRGVNETYKRVDVNYFWNALALFRPSELSDIETIKWDCGKINGHAVDVGGYIHYWLQGRPLHLHHFAETAIHSFSKVDVDQFLIHFTYNGNLNLEFRFDSRRNKIVDFQVKDPNRSVQSTWIFPHIPETAVIDLVETAASVFCEYHLPNATYGDPAIVGFVHSADLPFSKEPFIIHHKAGSSYLGHSDKYLHGKLEFIRSLLNIG